ncbi:MAG: hypothetical protein ACK4XY_09340 [Chloroherpetonaceae bacterium]
MRLLGNVRYFFNFNRLGLNSAQSYPFPSVQTPFSPIAFNQGHSGLNLCHKGLALRDVAKVLATSVMRLAYL